ncbi:MAG: DUF3299 domain-containing protein [Pikeienuella sp.]
MPVLVRRHLLLGALALPFAQRARAAADPVVLEWRDLVPGETDGTHYDTLRAKVLGIVGHGELDTGFIQELDAAITHDFDGKDVTIPGFMVPLDFAETGVTTLLLVPYVGACIHVPPPPPNQIIYVTTAEPYEVTGYFDPIVVTGEFNAIAKSTGLAEIGYRIEATRIEPYR